MTQTPPTCPYCGGNAVLHDSAVIYHGKSFGDAWICENYPECDAYVGCHKGTDRPLGRLADPELREAKKRAHAALDPWWVHQPKPKQARSKVYRWLAGELGLSEDECHIGMFDIAMCERVCQAVAKLPF